MALMQFDIQLARFKDSAKHVHQQSFIEEGQMTEQKKLHGCMRNAGFSRQVHRFQTVFLCLRWTPWLLKA